VAACEHFIDADICRYCGPPSDWLPPPDYGPWFQARYRGECDGCGAEIRAGDQIRSDNDGGYLCGLCGDRGGGTRDVQVREGLL
jgi:hypothetical protein